MYKHYFGKIAKAPLHYNILRQLGSIVDGVTGLIMLPFNRYGTEFCGDMAEKILMWQMKKWKKERKELK